MSTGNEMAGIKDTSVKTSSALQMPTGLHAEIDVTAADAVPSFTNGRYCYVDVAGLVKFDYSDPSGNTTHTEVKQFAAGVMYPIRNVTKVYKTGSAAQIYNAAGSAVVGLKVRK